MATASRPESAGKFEIESADDLIVGSPTSIAGATITGLLQNADSADIGTTRVDIYRVFPNDSDVGRTTADVEFADRDTASSPLMRAGPPEPDSLALLGAALLAIVVVKGRRPI